MVSLVVLGRMWLVGEIIALSLSAKIVPVSSQHPSSPPCLSEKARSPPVPSLRPLMVLTFPGSRISLLLAGDPLYQIFE